MTGYERKVMALLLAVRDQLLFASGQPLDFDSDGFLSVDFKFNGDDLSFQRFEYGRVLGGDGNAKVPQIDWSVYVCCPFCGHPRGADNKQTLDRLSLLHRGLTAIHQKCRETLLEAEK